MARWITISAKIDVWARLAGLPAGKIARRLKAGCSPFDSVWREKWQRVKPRGSEVDARPEARDERGQ